MDAGTSTGSRSTTSWLAERLRGAASRIDDMSCVDAGDYVYEAQRATGVFFEVKRGHGLTGSLSLYLLDAANTIERGAVAA